MNKNLYYPAELAENMKRIHVFYEDIDLGDVSGVLIDLDDTLYRYDPCHEAALSAAYTHSGLGFSKADYYAHYRIARNKVTERLDRQGACRSRLFAFQALCEEAGVSQPYFLAYELDRIYWTTFLAAMTPDKYALGFLNRCFENMVPVCIVTDMTAHVQIEKIRQLGIGGLVTHLVTSEEIGFEKPDPRMFLTALSKIGVAAEGAIMLGDSYAKDVEGALAVGIRAGLINLEKSDTSSCS